jgi:hypothetical protein
MQRTSSSLIIKKQEMLKKTKHQASEIRRGTPKENVDGRSTSSYDYKKFRARSMEKQKGMAFGFRQTATAVNNTG